MSFKDFSSAHPDHKPTPLTAKAAKQAMPRSAASMRAPTSHAPAPRQPSTKH